MATELEKACMRHGIKCVAEYGGAETPEGWPVGTHSYKVVLTRRNPRRQLTTSFHTGPALCKEPTADEVLYSLISDAQSVECAMGFEDWAGDLGYDTDSRKAEALYRAVLASTERVKRFLGDDLDTFAAAAEGY